MVMRIAQKFQFSYVCRMHLQSGKTSILGTVPHEELLHFFSSHQLCIHAFMSCEWLSAHTLKLRLSYQDSHSIQPLAYKNKYIPSRDTDGRII